AVFHRGVMGDAQHGIALAAVAERLVGVRRRRAGDGVALLVRLLGNVRPRRRLALRKSLRPVPVVLVPAHLELAHPERLDLDRMLRSLIGVAALLAFRTAHEELAARDRQHLEADLVGELLDVGLVLGLVNAGVLARRLAGREVPAGEEDEGRGERRQDPAERMLYQAFHVWYAPRLCFRPFADGRCRRDWVLRPRNRRASCSLA